MVEEAAEAGVTTLALTDHDAVAGVAEAAEAASGSGSSWCRRSRCPASTSTRTTCTSAATGSTSRRSRPACERAQHERVERAGEIVENLRREGFELHLEDAMREAGDALSIGRPHIARAAGASGDLGPFFEEYLVPGAKAFVPRTLADRREAIELIRAAGGVAVIAHPYWDISEPAEVEELIRALGSRRDRDLLPDAPGSRPRHLLGLCEELGLVPTGSSDYHGPTHKTFSGFGAYETYGLGRATGSASRPSPVPDRRLREPRRAGPASLTPAHERRSPMAVKAMSLRLPRGEEPNSPRSPEPTNQQVLKRLAT